MEHTPRINLINRATGQIVKVMQKEKIDYAVLEISPSSLTSNKDVKWLLTDFSRLYKPMMDRLNLSGGKLVITPEMNIWWEVFMHKGQIKFYLVVPNKDNIKDSITRQVMKTWKRANIKEVSDHMPVFATEDTALTKLTLKHNPILALDAYNANYSPLDSLLNAKHYLKDDDMAMLQIGLTPLGDDWNKSALDTMLAIKKGSAVPRKKGKPVTKGEIVRKVLKAIGLVAEEAINFMGDLLIPGWQEDRTIADSDKHQTGEISPNNRSTKDKTRSEAFKFNMNLVAQSTNEERRKATIRAMASGFDPLEGDNALVERPIPDKKVGKELKRVMGRQMSTKINGDILCSLELAKLIQVPDQKAQADHYNELSTVQHRGESEVPSEVFEDDGTGIPFSLYEDTNGEMKTVYFTGQNPNQLCMARVVIGEPGTGKSTFAQNFALDAFNRGYGVFMIDSADGKLMQRTLDGVRPEQRDKVKIVDFLNMEYPVGLGWNEIFRGRNLDVVEELVVEEVIGYIELVAGTELNMRARQWVENAVKATFVTPDATLQDVENMINNGEFRDKVIPTIDDPELRADWEYYHTGLKPEERKQIYDEAFRRLAPVMRKKALKNFILQRPKKDEEGNYLFDIRRWMDEGYLVLIRANESLGETLQTALVSFLIAKFNLAMVSREDIVDENDRRPCFLLLDEPDHYIKGSERWRNMLTRYRKYRCGLVFMFHGWQQLKEADKDLPKIIRKAGPHYVIFQTDLDNLLELKSVVEPEFKIDKLAKGMPEFHAVIRLKMYGKTGEVVPAFMAKSLGKTEDLFPPHNNNDLFDSCAREIGRPKKDVMEEIFANRTGAEFIATGEEIISGGEIKIVEEIEEDEDHKKFIQMKMEYEVGAFIQEQIDNGEDVDYELIEHMDEILGGDYE